MRVAKFVRGFFGAAALVACGISHAAYTAYIYQSGPNVVASGSGSLNLAALLPMGGGSTSALVQANSAWAVFGSAPAMDGYGGGILGPTFFGVGGLFFASSAGGDFVFIRGNSSRVFVPAGYLSGAPLASTAAWDGTTIAGLGLTPGTYTWTWGAGPTADSFTLNIGAAPPAPATPASIPALSEWGLIGLSGLIALFGLARARRRG